MLRRIVALTAFFLGATLSVPAKNPPLSGIIVSQQSVECGSKKDGKKSTSLLCHQYTVRTTTTEYQIRQPKPSEQAIFPPNTPIQFTIEKDKMKFKVNGDSYKFLIVGMSTTNTAK
jgi:hypothetical protein